MPVLEKPGSLDGLVKAPAPKFLPDGYELASDFADAEEPGAEAGRPQAPGQGIEGRPAEVSCPRAFDACHDGRLSLKANDRYKGK